MSRASATRFLALGILTYVGVAAGLASATDVRPSVEPVAFHCSFTVAAEPLVVTARSEDRIVVSPADAERVRPTIAEMLASTSERVVPDCVVTGVAGTTSDRL